MNVSIIEPIGGHGGMDYYDYGLAYGLGKNGVNVLFYTSDKTTPRIFENVQTKLIFKSVWGSAFIKKTFFYIRYHIEAYYDSMTKKVDVVHLHFFFFRSIDLLLLLLAKLFKFKIVGTIHDVNSFHKSSNSFIEAWCYKLIDGIILHNQSSLRALQVKSVDFKNITIIPHGNYLPFISTFTKSKKPGPIFKMLFFGQIKEVKGIDVLLKALSLVTQENQNISLVIAGKAWKSDLATYEKLIDELGLKNFVKTDFRYIPDEKVASFFAETDLVVLPYKEIYQSGVLLLAMSYEKPILCSDLQPFTDILKDEITGFIFESEDVKDMSKKILKIMDSPQLLNEVTINASALVKRDFDWVEIGRKTEDFYKQVLK